LGDLRVCPYDARIDTLSSSACWTSFIVRLLVLGKFMKLLALAALAALLMLTPAEAYLFCSEPNAPYCANSYSSFSTGREFDDCKLDMESYQNDVEQYVSCLADASDDAIRDYNEAVRSFNRRAGGY
jgi:hypothetical protein